PVVDWTVLSIGGAAADEAGIGGEVTGILADRGVSIRQVLSEDPEFTDDPKLYVITDAELSGDLLVEIRDLGYVRRVGF
ncbi:amino acid-binding protein, partial [Halorubrum sp. SD612]